MTPTQFDNILSQSTLHGLTKSERKFIKKIIRTRIILPSPSVIKLILPVLNYKPQQQYNDYTIDSILDVSKLIYTVHNTHEFDGLIPISNTYKNKIFRHYSQSNLLFNQVFNISRFGNNQDSEGCSSYTLHKDIDNKDFVYSSKDNVYGILSNLIKTKDFNQYVIDYNNTMCDSFNSKIQELDKIKVVSKIILSDTSDTFDNTVIKTYEFSEQQLENITLAKDYYETVSTGNAFADAANKRKLNELNNLTNNIVDNKLYFKNHISELSSREYHMLNSLSKVNRGHIFNDMVSLDISNMAFRSIKNQHKHLDLPYMSMYIDNRSSIIERISDEVYYQHNYYVDLKTGYKNTVLYNEIKSYCKLNFLHFLFGGKTTVMFSSKHLDIFSILHNVFSNDIFTINLFNEIKDNFNCSNKNELSIMFMKEETLIRNSIIKVFTNFDYNLINKIVDIHDGILIPDISYNSSVINKLKEIELKYNTIITGIEDINVIDNNKVYNKNILGYSNNYIIIYNKVKHLLNNIDSMLLRIRFSYNNYYITEYS